MGFFDKMFEKKECAICGTELGLLGKTKISEGYLCKECAGKLSPYFHGYRSSTADDIREQLAYREANAERLASFNPTRTLSAGRTNIMLDEDAGLLIITSQSRWRDANPDIIEFSQVLGCDMDIDEHRTEIYRERQDKADAKADAAAAVPKPAVDDAVQELAQNAGYICSSCGAELVSDGTVAVTTCPYCGNSAVAPGQLSGDFSPDLVIPFKLGRDDVTATLKEHYKGKILLPKSFVTGNHIDEVQGVYVPFWLYGARVDGEVCFDATNETVTEESDRTVTTTDHYDAYRKGNISFERVPVDGSSKMPDGHMDAIEPFDYDALRPFSVAYMPGYIANRYDEDCETCKARAERRMEESTISALRETVVDEYDDATVESKRLDYTWEDSDYALFPVWMLSTSWNGKSYLFAMNGQTGRMVGELPCSKPKLVIASVLFFVIGFVLSQILFMGGNAFDPDYLTFDVEGILINIVAPLIIVIIADVLLVGQLKTANEATHADCYCGELDLTEKHDTFSHTETTVVMKDNKDD